MRINKKNLGKDKSLSFLLIFWDKENVFFLLIYWDGGSTTQQHQWQLKLSMDDSNIYINQLHSYRSPKHSSKANIV